MAGRNNQIFDPFSIGNLLDPFDIDIDIFDTAPKRSYARDARAMAGTRVDWVETADAHIFKADLPGLTKEEIKIQLVDGRTLEISGERRKDEEKKDDRWHRVERRHGRFLRRFRLPKNANTDAVNAKAENGVLTVTVPKIPKPKPQTTAIEIA